MSDEECRIFMADGNCYDNKFGSCDCWCHKEEDES